MKSIVITIILFFSFLKLTYAADTWEARKFAKEYENEVKEKRQAQVEEKKGIWKTDINIKSGLATYEEEEQTIKSDWDAFYYEVEGKLTRQSENDIETALALSYGRSLIETETWFVSNIKYQTNDLDFWRFNIKGSLGKILYSGESDDFRVIPFLGYGFRLINFARTNFNVLNIITSREVVTEKYYIHHLDVGLKVDAKLSPTWGISGLGSFGYVVYNQADNNALGKITGSGGFLVEGGLNLEYYMTNSLQLVFGGFVELENLRGGEKGDVIWPDNKLNIYGGRIGLRYLF